MFTGHLAGTGDKVEVQTTRRVQMKSKDQVETQAKVPTKRSKLDQQGKRKKRPVKEGPAIGVVLQISHPYIDIIAIYNYILNCM